MAKRPRLEAMSSAVCFLKLGRARLAPACTRTVTRSKCPPCVAAITGVVPSMGETMSTFQDRRMISWTTLVNPALATATKSGSPSPMCSAAPAATSACTVLDTSPFILRCVMSPTVLAACLLRARVCALERFNSTNAACASKWRRLEASRFSSSFVGSAHTWAATSQGDSSAWSIRRTLAPPSINSWVSWQSACSIAMCSAVMPDRSSVALASTDPASKTRHTSASNILAAMTRNGSPVMGSPPSTFTPC
mmetsp:Transcript_88543/g.236626  ORF Transcript_88543/g.236626 Transcript_88543/m.236626 type:complete len:250 (+) Transcript_88543:2409-3158(+)